MSAVKGLVRWVVWGRTDGVRAAIRARLGVFTWVDRPYPDPQHAGDGPGASSSPARAGWRRILASGELAEGQVTEVVTGELTLALARIEGMVFAVDGICPHAAGPLAEGHLREYTLTCPVHGWSYDIRTGASSVRPDVNLQTFRVVEEGGAIWLVA